MHNHNAGIYDNGYMHKKDVDLMQIDVFFIGAYSRLTRKTRWFRGFFIHDYPIIWMILEQGSRVIHAGLTKDRHAYSMTLPHATRTV